jgi:tRNA(Ile)-lysidine synthase
LSHLDQMVQKFLKRCCSEDRPVLLGLSGGPDSLSLFHLLFPYVDLRVAHVDHGWRDESQEEASILRALCEDKGVPFHLRTLNSSDVHRNREEHCRNERLAFFGEICTESGCQSLVLGHHADDQAETVLKRILEGAPLVRQGAMRGSSKYGSLTIWRPLLGIAKKSIIAWLEQRNIPFFIDPTNEDPAILRSRMRTQILPELFGKEIALPLARHADEAALLADYLDARIVPFMETVKESSKVDLSDVHLLEVRHLIRRLDVISHQQLVGLSEAIQNKSVSYRQGSFFAHLGILHYVA